MAVFNPDVPEAQEPNYLRYSRPSNYAPVNKAAGEAVKGIATVVGQTSRAADSLVSEGIKSSVSKQAEADADRYIHGTLEPEYNRRYGTNFGQEQSLVSSYADDTPKEVKDLPKKIDALNAFKAKGSFVNTQYTGQLDALAKNMRSQFPGYRDVIDREVNRASGKGEANPYARNLMAGIQAYDDKMNAAKKEDLKWTDEAFKRGLIDPTYLNKVYSGEATADRAKEMLNMDFRRQHDHENRMHQIAETEGNDKVAHIAGRRAVEGYADDTLNIAMQSSQNFFMKGGIDIAQHQRDVAEGKTPHISEQEKLAREQQFTIMADKMAHDIQEKTAKAHNVLNEGEAEKIIADYKQRFRDWLGMSESKEYAAAPFDIANVHKSRMGDFDDELRTKFPKLADYMDRRKMMQERSDKDWEKYTEKNSFDTTMQDHIKSFVNSSSVRSGSPNPDENPSLKEDLTILDKHGGDGTAKQRLLEIPELIKGVNSVESKRNWIKYAFGGDNPNIFRDIEVDSRDNKGNIKQGRYSIYEKYTDPGMVAAVKALGPESWNTYKEGLTTAFSHSLFGHEIATLGNAPKAGYEVSYNTENGHFAVKGKTGEGLSVDLKEGGADFKESINRLNRGIDGVRNILKEDGTDPNAYILREFASDKVDLSNIEGIPTKMRDAILNSHGSMQPEQGPEQGRDKGKHSDATPGQVLSDATSDQVKPGQQYASMAKQPEIIPGKIPPEGGGGGAPVIPGTFDSRLLGREMPPEIPSIKEQRLNYGEPTPTKPTPPGKIWDLDKTQKKLDRTLKKAGDVAKEHTEAVESSYRKAEENIFAREAPAQNVIGRFRDHPREQEILENKLKSLQLQAKNVGPKGLVGTHARNEAKLIKARLKEIEDVNEETE